MELKLPQRRVQRAQTAGQPTFDPSSLSGEARGMQQLGGQLATAGIELSRKAKQAERAATAATAVNQYRLEADEYINEHGKSVGGYLTFEQDFIEKHKELQEKILGDVEDEQTKAAINTKLGQLGTDYQLKVRHAARKQQISFAQISTTRALGSLSRTAVDSDPNDLTQKFQEMQSLIEVQTDAGIYTPDQANKLLIDTRNDIYTSRIKRDMAADPEETYNNLLDKDYYPELPEDKRSTLTETARKRAETAAKAEERDRLKRNAEEEKAIKIRQDQTAGLGYSLLQDNQLDELWLEDARERRFLKASDYQKLKDAMNNAQKGGGVTDPDTFYAVQNKIYAGDYTIGQLYSHVGHGLTYDDVRELQTIVQEGSPVFKTKTYQEARAYVRESMGVLKFGTIGPALGPKVARASRELYERVKAGADPMKAADDIVARYNKREQGLPSERGYPGKSKVELRKMLQANMITTSEYNTEVEMIAKEERRAKRTAE